MSLKEVYTLAHTAQCRLNMEANRPDRNLRFVVGHLMHYEALRLRIVEIEHDVPRVQHSKNVQCRGANYVDHRLQHQYPNGRPSRKSPPPPPIDDVEFLEDMVDDDDEEAGGLSLQRFPSGSSRQSQPLPDLELDEPDGDHSEDEEPASPEDPDPVALKNALQTNNCATLAKLYEGVRRCPCHGETGAPRFERMWELPVDGGKANNGKMRIVAEVAVAAS